MRQLLVADGDLVATPSGHATVSGAARIRQDLSLALSEPYGDDRFHPQWGSTLPRYVGMAVNIETQMMVRAEVTRVVQSYIATQRADILLDATAQRRSRYSTFDVVQALNDVSARAYLDSIRVAVRLSTAAGEDIAVAQEVTL